MIGGEYVDNSSSTIKGFFLYSGYHYSENFKFLYSTGTHDIVNKVVRGTMSIFAAGKSGTGSSATFFVLKAINRFDPVRARQIASDTTSVDPTSEIGKSI